jgi:hypothetical protein
VERIDKLWEFGNLAECSNELSGASGSDTAYALRSALSQRQRLKIKNKNVFAT